MKLVSYNIQFGLGRDGRNDLARIAAEIDGADIISLQEVERHWRHSGGVRQPEDLARMLDRYYWVYGPYFDVDASSADPDGRVVNVRRQFGNMVLSKTPVLSTRVFPLSKSIIHDKRNMDVGMMEAVVRLPDDKALRIYNTHLSAKSATDRISQIHHIRKLIHRRPGEGGAWTGSNPDPLWSEDRDPPPMPEDFVLMGDFNLAPQDAEYGHLVRGDDNEADLNDCWTLCGHGLHQGVTFRAGAKSGTAAGGRIDFAFVGETLKNHVLGAKIDDGAQGSDHQPIWIELDIG